MKTFYSASDIETLVSQGVHELIVDDDVVLTSVARETAAQLGVKLAAPGQRVSVSPEAVAPAPAVSPLKPRGCQHHSRAASGQGQGATPQTAASPVVDDLIGAVKQLAKRG